MKHKYIRHSSLGFILWPMTDDVFHQHMQNLFRRERGEIISAGFVEFDDKEAFCYGRSESIGIGGLPDDSEVLNKQLGFA